ncbi:transketolase, partial [candidate division KSB1 bacterium]|nr:transketolase [candidate division KSB1 bacterium]
RYREQVLPPSIGVRLAIEAGSTMGWERYVGNSNNAAICGLTGFGLSAPIEDVMSEFGLTVDNVVDKVTGLLK